MNLDWTIDNIETQDNTSNTSINTTETQSVNNNDIMNMEGYQQTLNKLSNTYEGKACTFSDVETIAQEMLSTLPTLNTVALLQEMEDMKKDIFLCDDPSTFQLTEALCKVQEYKNRLTEITTIVDHEYSVRKRVQEMLFDANQAVSKMSSADKRKGEATMRYPIQILKYENICNFRTVVSNYMTNMRSMGDTISRQASILNMQISLGEYRKKMPSEFNNTLENVGLDYKTGAPILD